MVLFLSDCHLGNKHCQAQKLLDFLQAHHKEEEVFLIGDIIDDHQMKRWPYLHWMCLRQILQFKKIVYLPGNHDSFMRRFFGEMIPGKVTIANHWMYRGTDNQYYFVTHGDQYDWITRYTHFLSSSRIAKLGRRFLFEPLHSYLAQGDSFYRNNLIKAAKEYECTGVICGHSHAPQIEKISGFNYLNTGDWIDNCTAIIDKDGEFTLYRS